MDSNIKRPQKASGQSLGYAVKCTLKDKAGPYGFSSSLCHDKKLIKFIMTLQKVSELGSKYARVKSMYVYLRFQQFITEVITSCYEKPKIGCVKFLFTLV